MLCNVTGTLYLPNGQLGKSLTLRFKRADQSVTAEYLGAVVPNDVYTQSDKSGQVDFEILTGVYVMHVEGGYSVRAIVPDAATSDIADCIDAAAIPDQPPVWYQQALDARDEAEDAADRAEDAASQAAGAVVADYFVATDADRLALSPSEGETAYVSQTGRTWKWQSGAWVDMGVAPFAFQSEVDLKADRQNSGKTFVSRQQAADAGQVALSGGIGPILVREGNYLEIRGPGQTADQLFTNYPNWGILDRLPVNGLFVSTVSQAGIIHLVGEAATVAGDVTTITAELAPSTLTAGLTVGPGTKAMLTLPPALVGDLRLQVAGDTARPIRREQNDVTARAEDVEPGSTLLLRQFSGNWVIQSGAVGIASIEGLRDSVALLGKPVDGFENAFSEGFLTIGTGQIASASTSWSYTDFIPVSRGQVVDYVGRINRNQGAAIAYYDSNHAYLNDGLVADPAGPSPLQNVVGTVTIPAGVAFIRAATLNTVAHSLSYVPSAASPEAFAEGVVSVMENVAGTEKLRLQAAITALLSGSAMPSTLANLPGIGDSFTVGANASPAANRFLNRVATALGATVTNYGQGGTVLQNSNGSGGTPLNNNGRDRFRALFMGSAKKDFALIAYGFNDARYTAAPSTFNVAAYQSDYREMIVGLLGDGYRRDQILVVGPHYITDVGLTTGTAGFTGQTRAGFEEYVTAAQDVAEEFGVLYFDSYAHMRDNGGASLIDTDNIHPTNEGHEVIATGILQETTVLNQRSAPAISGWQGSGTALTLTWGSVAGAVSYEVARARFDTLVVTAATASQTSNSHEFTGLAAGQYVGMVRAVFSDGPGPWSVSTPRTI